MSARLLASLPLLFAAILLAAGGAPFFWPLALAAIALIAVLVPWRAQLTTFTALLWMIAGATGPVVWVRSTTSEPTFGVSAALLFLGIAGARLFLENPVVGRTPSGITKRGTPSGITKRGTPSGITKRGNFDRALVVFACIACGIGAKSAVYPYVTAMLAASMLLELGGGFAAAATWVRIPRATVSVVMLSVALTTFVSFALPALDRATNRRFQALFAGRLARVNFTPHVRLDQPGFIRTNDDIVLRLHGAEADYLRGAIFDSFDGAYWTTAAHGVRAIPQGTPTNARTYVDAAESSRWLFAPRGTTIVSDTSFDSDPLGVFRPTERRAVTHWEFAPLEASSADEDPKTDADLIVPPRLIPKLEVVAREWTDGVTGDRARANALMHHLQTEFRYTLDRPATPRGQSELLDFLFVHREGHCEFFASAFVMLARVIGIPARLVAGFRVVEHNDFGGYAVVRAKHAHAWAEAWVPSADGHAGFEVFDATPAGVETLGEVRTRTFAAFVDYLRIRIIAMYDAAVASPEKSIPVLGGIVVIAFIVRALRNRRKRVAVAEPIDVPPDAFIQFEARLARDGFVRDRAETLEAFAERIESERPEIAAALRRYVKARYGAGSPSESDFVRVLRLSAPIAPGAEG